MVGGWLLQGAPGVLTPGAKYDPSERITDSQVVRVEGGGWRAPWSIHEVYFQDGGHKVDMTVFVRNGGSGRSQPTGLLVEFQLSNYSARIKEKIRFAPADIEIHINGQSFRPNASIECRLLHRNEELDEKFQPMQAIEEVPPGESNCLALRFPVTPPSGNIAFQIKGPRITLGERPLDAPIIHFGLIYG
jgi:hypothetical protein